MSALNPKFNKAAKLRNILKHGFSLVPWIISTTALNSNKNSQTFEI